MTKVQNPALANATCCNEWNGQLVVHTYDADGVAVIHDHTFAELLVETCGHVILETDYEPRPPATIEEVLAVFRSVLEIAGAENEHPSVEQVAEAVRGLGGDSAVNDLVGAALGVARRLRTAEAELNETQARVVALESIVATLTAAAGAPAVAPAVAPAPAEAPAPEDAADEATAPAEAPAPEDAEDKPTGGAGRRGRRRAD